MTHKVKIMIHTKTLIGEFKDKVIGKSYDLLICNAKELSKELKDVLSKMGIDYEKFNSYTPNSFSVDKSIENPPVEIYEYQNFFIIELDNGDSVLLDGFRRLLWYNSPYTDINVRKYKKSDLTDQEILSLLVNLNHFKFHGGTAYHERGFSLLLRTIFDLDITDIKSAFDGYLSKNSTRSSYGRGNKSEVDKQDKNDLIKDRIVSKNFISNVRFLVELKERGYMSDKFVGALLFKKQSESEETLSIDSFIEIAESNETLKDLMARYDKVGTDSSTRSMEVVNKIIEIYENIFTQMKGGEVELSFGEKLSDVKSMVDKLKRDKTLVKMTGNKSIHRIEEILLDMIKKGETPEFRCVVHPSTVGDFNKGKVIPYGVYTEVELVGHRKRHLGFGITDPVFNLKVGENSFEMWHTFARGFSSGFSKKFTTLNDKYVNGYTSSKIDLFIKMDKKLLK